VEAKDFGMMIGDGGGTLGDDRDELATGGRGAISFF
jgi:hypothetical protein